MKALKILSLGAGVQSSTVLLMSCYGELPKLDAAIFADTQWEPSAVYKHFDKLKAAAESAGIPVQVVTKGNIRKEQQIAIVGSNISRRENVAGRFAAIPLFTKNRDGSVGQIKRQCTAEYKIEPIDRHIRRELLGLKPRQRVPSGVVVEQWFGISADELRRCRWSNDKWRIFRYPLIEDALPPMRRGDCQKWLDARGWLDVPRSACIGCPYHTVHEWRFLRENAPGEWADAVAFDKMIRHRDAKGSECYLVRECVPLDELDLSTEAERGQGDLFDGFRDECAGMCGV